MALKFSAEGDIVHLRKDVSKGQSQLTVSVWVYPRSGGAGTQDIIGNGANSVAGNATFWVQKVGGALGGGISNGTGVNNTGFSTTTLTDNEWAHCVFHWDGATMSGYVNGVVGTTTKAASGDINSSPLTDAIKIGEGRDNLDFRGDIAQVSIWNTALTHPEIIQLARGVDPELIRPNSLITLQDLHGDTLNFHPDRSFHANHSSSVAGTIERRPEPPQLKPQIKRTLKRPWHTLLETAAAATQVLFPIKKIFSKPSFARQFLSATDDYLEIPDTGDFDGQFPMTIYGWIKRNDSSGDARMIGTDATGRYGFGTVGSQLKFTKIAAADVASTALSGSYSTTEWMFVAAVVTSTNIRFVIISPSGNIDAEDRANSSSFTNGSATSVFIGRWRSAIQPLKGSMASIGKTNTALSDDQLLALSRTTNPQSVGITPEVHINITGQSSIEFDISKNKNDGKVTGAKPALGPPQLKPQVISKRFFPFETAVAAATDFIYAIRRLFERPVLAARNFNETDQYGTIADHPDLTLPDDDWTIAIKFRLNGNTGTLFKYIMSNDAFSVNSSLNILIREASASTPDRIDVMIEDAGGDIYDDGTLNVRSSSSPGSRTSWQTWFFQREGTTLRLYDGNTDVGSATNAAVGAINSANDLHIGRRQDTPTDRWFGGDIEFVAKWDRALSSVERLSIMRGQPANKFAADLKYYVPCDDSPKGIDLSGNHHHITWFENPKPALASPEARKTVLANRFFGFGAAAGATESLTHTTDSLLLKTSEITHTTDALLKTTPTVTQLTDALLQTTVTVTHTTDALLKTTVEVDHTTDAFLSTANTVSHLTDSLLRQTLTQTHLTDSLLLETLTLDHTTDALLAIQNSITHTTDSLAFAQNTLAHSTDSYLESDIVPVRLIIDGDSILTGTRTEA